MGRKGLPPVIYLSLAQNAGTLATWLRVYALLLARAGGYVGGREGGCEGGREGGPAWASTPAIETEDSRPNSRPSGIAAMQTRGGGGG